MYYPLAIDDDMSSGFCFRVLTYTFTYLLTYLLTYVHTSVQQWRIMVFRALGLDHSRA